MCLHLMISFFVFSWTPLMSAIIPSRFISRVKFSGFSDFFVNSRGGDLLILSFDLLSSLIMDFMKSEAKTGLGSCCFFKTF